MYGKTDAIDNLVGGIFDFYGAAEHQFKIGNQVFEATEDPGDSYRSCLESVVVVDKSKETIFFNQPIAKVKLVKAETADFEGYNLVDAGDGHVWLEFGTNVSDDYYPCFIFQYTPKPNLKPLKNYVIEQYGNPPTTRQVRVVWTFDDGRLIVLNDYGQAYIVKPLPVMYERTGENL